MHIKNTKSSDSLLLLLFPSDSGGSLSILKPQNVMQSYNVVHNDVYYHITVSRVLNFMSDE